MKSFKGNDMALQVDTCNSNFPLQNEYKVEAGAQPSHSPSSNDSGCPCDNNFNDSENQERISFRKGKKNKYASYDSVYGPEPENTLYGTSMMRLLKERPPVLQEPLSIPVAERNETKMVTSPVLTSNSPIKSVSPCSNISSKFTYSSAVLENEESSTKINNDSTNMLAPEIADKKENLSKSLSTFLSTEALKAKEETKTEVENNFAKASLEASFHPNKNEDLLKTKEADTTTPSESKTECKTFSTDSVLKPPEQRLLVPNNEKDMTVLKNEKLSANPNDSQINSQNMKINLLSNLQIESTDENSRDTMSKQLIQQNITTAKSKSASYTESTAIVEVTLAPCNEKLNKEEASATLFTTTLNRPKNLEQHITAIDGKLNNQTDLKETIETDFSPNSGFPNNEQGISFEQNQFAAVHRPKDKILESAVSSSPVKEEKIIPAPLSPQRFLNKSSECSSKSAESSLCFPISSSNPKSEHSPQPNKHPSQHQIKDIINQLEKKDNGMLPFPKSPLMYSLSSASNASSPHSPLKSSAPYNRNENRWSRPTKKSGEIAIKCFSDLEKNISTRINDLDNPKTKNNHEILNTFSQKKVTSTETANEKQPDEKTNLMPINVGSVAQFEQSTDNCPSVSTLLKRVAGDIKEEDVIGRQIMPNWATQQDDIVKKTPAIVPSAEDIPLREKPTPDEILKCKQVLGQGFNSHNIFKINLRRPLKSLDASLGLIFTCANSFDDYLTVQKVVMGSIADRSEQIEKGDKVLFIQGTSTKRMETKNARALLKQPSEFVILVLARSFSTMFSSPSEMMSTATVDPGTFTFSNETEEVVLMKGTLGVGISLDGGKASVFGDRPIVIKCIFEGTEAAKRGCLKVGDRIVKIGSTDIEGLTYTEANKILRTSPKGPLKIVFRSRL